MSEITIDESKLLKKPVMLDETGCKIASELGKLVLATEAANGVKLTQVADWQEVSDMVAEGLAPDVFPVGTVLHVPWSDVRTATDAEWDVGFRVVHHGPADVYGKGACNAMWLHQELCVPFGTQFDQFEAFYAAPEGGLPAGTYNLSFDTTWGKFTSGESVSFTLTKDLPEGGQLAFSSQTYDYAPTSLNVNAYATCGATEAQESVPVEAGASGTNLGTLSNAAIDESGAVNQIHRVGLGSNRWATSGVRQWLNSSGAAGSWWSPQTKWDRPPSYLSTAAGFMSGLPADFREHLAPVVQATAIPYCDGGTSGGTQADETHDKVFLPSAEQLYWATSGYGIPYGLEGEAWDYWRQVWAQDSPAPLWTVHKEFVKYSLGAETTACSVFQRSAYRSNGSNVPSCYSSGHVGNTSAYGGDRCAPACCIV